ncbi:MAG: FkbH-like protein [Candidatus Woesearchaeota archaeon]|jgi:FkbH-like protein
MSRKCKITILPTYTCNHIIKPLTSQLTDYDIQAEISMGEYNQVCQSLLATDLDNSDLVVIATNFETYFDQIFYVENKVKYMQSKLELLLLALQKVKSHILIPLFRQPKQKPLGIGESTHGIGKLVHQANDALYKLAENKKNITLLNPDVYLQHDTIVDQKMYYIGKICYTQNVMNDFATNITRTIFALFGMTKKVLVCDLDNTLWGGVAGEDGPQGVIIGTDGLGSIYTHIQKIIKTYMKRGILLALSSKNNPEDVDEVFFQRDMPLQLTDFVCLKINWDNKIKSLQDMAQELNIGLQSFVFLDDNPAERALISQMLPEVTVLDFPQDIADLPSILGDLAEFDTLAITEEDQTRNEQYQSQQKRKDLQEIDTKSYLEKLGIFITVKKDDLTQIPRITQLINKTNQFNVTTKRYTQQEVESFIHSDIHHIYSLQAADTFGDLGITGVLIFVEKKDHIEVNTFLMSCRIMGRELEFQFFLEAILDLKPTGIIHATYIQTTKNSPVIDLFEKLGFLCTQESQKEKLYELKSENIDIKKRTFIEVRS